MFCVSHDDLPRGPLMRSLVVVREDTLERTNRSRLIFTRFKNLIAMCCHFHREHTNSREIPSEIVIATQHRCVHGRAMRFRQSLQLAQTTPAMMATRIARKRFRQRETAIAKRHECLALN